MKWNDPKVSFTLVLMGLICLMAAGKLNWAMILVPLATVVGYGRVRIGRSAGRLRHGIE